EEVFRSLRNLAIGMLAQTFPDSHSKDTRARARALFDAGSATGSYFATAERCLPATLQALAEADIERARHVWRTGLWKAAEAAWWAARRSIGMGPGALRADALFHPRYRSLLSSIRPQSLESTAIREEQV